MDDGSSSMAQHVSSHVYRSTSQTQIDTPNRARELVATCVSVYVVCIFAVIVRLFTRMHLLRVFSLDDSLIVLATLCAGALTGILIHATQTGLGMHVYDLTVADLSSVTLVCALCQRGGTHETTDTQKHLWIAYLVFNFTVGVTKISTVLSYLRLFSSTKWTRIACIVFLVVLVLNTIITVTIGVLTCRPISLFWHMELIVSPAVFKSHCLNLKAMWFAEGYLYITFDLLLILLPIPVVKSLRISRREKVAVASIFALGGFGCICSFLRLRSFGKAAGTKDPGWDNVDSARWTVIEVAVGIICASLAQCKALVTRAFPHLLAPRHANKDMPSIAVTALDNRREWNATLERGMRREAMRRGRRDYKRGIVHSTVEKGDAEADGATGASAILVTTTVTQRRESRCSDWDGDFDTPRNNSITPSQVSLPPIRTEGWPG